MKIVLILLILAVAFYLSKAYVKPAVPDEVLTLMKANPQKYSTLSKYSDEWITKAVNIVRYSLVLIITLVAFGMCYMVVLL